jgi:hypothetical protein
MKSGLKQLERREEVILLLDPCIDNIGSRTADHVHYNPRRVAPGSMKDAKHLARDSARAISPPFPLYFDEL